MPPQQGSSDETSRESESEMDEIAKHKPPDLTNPEELDAFRRKTFEEARQRHPHLTDEQLENSWRQMLEQFGLG